MSQLRVEQKTVEDILSKNHYLIPEYQRPYAWDEDKCRTLWDDIKQFVMQEKFDEDKEAYFLGPIVTFKNKNEEGSEILEVIDGQQRITTLLLLLRAIYDHLEPDKDVNLNSKGIRSRIVPCIWHTDKKTTEPYPDKIRIETKSITEEHSKSFRNILIGTTKPTGKEKDLYSKNYILFQGWIKEYVQTHTNSFHDLCVRILDNCILLPIECDSEDDALRIFTTLNDRGLQLSDSDIFKAQLYKSYKEDKEKQDYFIKRWQELSEKCDIDEIFTLYMYWLNARDGIKSTTVQGLRNYFVKKLKEKDKNDKTINDVIALADFWNTILRKEIDIDKGISEETLKYTHCLEHFPNKFWKYNLTVFFFTYKGDNDTLDEGAFCDFVKQTLAYCFVAFTIKSTINNLKNACIPQFVNLAKKDPKEPFKYPDFNKDDFQHAFSQLTPKMIKPYLVWEAYQHDLQELIQLPNNKLEIEHILPKNWPAGNYKYWNKDNAEQYSEKIGNKILIDKKTNIKARDDFFGEKKKRYEKSPIEVVKQLAKDYAHDDWIDKDIDNRERKLLADFVAFARKAGIKINE